MTAALSINGCGGQESEAPLLCPADECSDSQWQGVFEQAVLDLHAEGVELTTASIESGDAQIAIAERMAKLTGGVIPADEPAAKGYTSARHCGKWILSMPVAFCMNSTCYRHDKCYEAIRGFNTVCSWSSETQYCDQEFFNDYQQCRTAGMCDWKCRAVGAAAEGLLNLCSTQSLYLIPSVAAICALRIGCPSCIGVDTATMCQARDAVCGDTTDGCGATSSCGSCAPGSECRVDEQELDNACVMLPVTCGNGTCGAGETCSSCPQDCGACPCGNGTCGACETCSTCPQDCGACPTCGNGTCATGETCSSCPQDCGACPTCGNGSCGAGETCSTCPQDCGACPTCGNGTCGTGETCSTCPQDCGACPTCGNGTCGAGETCSTCPQDCGGCPCASCTDQDGDGHYHLSCADTTCTARDDCDDDYPTIYGGAPELCDGRDNDCDGIIDDNDACWRPVYRFWNTSAPPATTPRCYGNSPSTPSGCAGYTLEFSGPVFFVYASSVPGTVEFLAFDRTTGTDHLMVRAGTSEAAALGAAGSGWTLRGSLGYFWADTVNPPGGLFYRPPAASTSAIRDLRRYYHPTASIHLFPNNPVETALGWTFEGVRAWMWSSRW